LPRHTAPVPDAHRHTRALLLRSPSELFSCRLWSPQVCRLHSAYTGNMRRQTSPELNKLNDHEGSQDGFSSNGTREGVDRGNRGNRGLLPAPRHRAGVCCCCCAALHCRGARRRVCGGAAPCVRHLAYGSVWRRRAGEEEEGVWPPRPSGVHGSGLRRIRVLAAGIGGPAGLREPDLQRSTSRIETL
jgi:hypothetical protein